MNIIRKCIMDADLRGGHDYLARLAMTGGLDITTLKQGDVVVFLNRKQDKVKVYAHNNIIAYWRSPSGRISLDMIRWIPRCFNGKDFDFNQATKKMIETAMLRKAA